MSTPCGLSSSVGIATGYGLDGPGIESWWGRDFPHLSRPSLGPTSLVYNGYRVFLGGKERPGRDADPSHPSSAVVKKEKNYTSTHPVGRTTCTESRCLYTGALYLLYPLLKVTVTYGSVSETVYRLQTVDTPAANLYIVFFILVINQLDAQNFCFYNEFISCLYMFRVPCAHHQEVKIALHSLWYHHTYRWPSGAWDGHLQV